MWLIIGLGNPGRKYLYARHNIGFRVIDWLSRELSIPLNRKKFFAKWEKGYWEKKVVILAKPQTFMNLSGEAVAGLQRFYHIDLEHLIIIYDDLDLMFGNIKIREKGGAGGHNGLKSIISHVGGTQFVRIRFGIGRPDQKGDEIKYVLEPFDKDQKKLLAQQIDQAGQAVKTILSEGTEHAMNRFNRKKSCSL